MKFESLQTTDRTTKQAMTTPAANSITTTATDIVATSKSEENKQAFNFSLFTFTPAADKGSGVTILGCPTSSPYVHASEITLPPSFLRRIMKVISQMEWRPYFEVAAKRRRDWFEALRKVDGLTEGSEETALKRLLSDKSGKKFPHEYLAFFQYFLRLLLLSLKCHRLSCFWLTPSIPRSLRSPTFSSL